MKKSEMYKKIINDLIRSWGGEIPDDRFEQFVMLCDAYRSEVNIEKWDEGRASEREAANGHD